MNVAAPSGDLSVAKNSDADIFGGEAGIVKALSTLRHAAIPPKDKDSLRDLFLTYTGESDDTKRSAIKNEIIKQIEKNPQLASLIISTKNTSTEPKTQDAPKFQLGQTRPAPNFVVSETPPVKVAVETVPNPPVPITNTEVVPEKVAPTVIPITPPPEITPEPAPVPVPQPPTAPPPVPAEVQPVAVPPTPPPAPIETEPALVPAPTPTPAPSAPAPVAPTDVRARIDAIKHDINSRVGNPVNVIDADETIGREYMTALLDAMKRSSTSSGPESLPRLEAAYKATLDLIIEKGLGTSPSTSTANKAPEVSVAPDTVEVTVPVTEPTSAPEVTLPPVTKIELPTPEPPQQSEGLYHRPSDEIEAETIPEKAKPSLASKLFKAPLSAKQDVEEKPIAPEMSAPEVKKVETNPTVEPKTSNPPTPTQSEKLQPLKNTSVALPEKMAAIKAAATKREEEAKKPITDLKSPEIEAGLRQLLSEWVLFKKSGFLGTGPSGIDHPLYKQLSGMPMASVISGRFEGVTPEIKRHLSDYMTGWRYEQGIMHEMGETFENYLRRVIRQVLERQRTQVNKNVVSS